jgi:predicted transcriptional regulator of viral defense system
MRHHRCCIRKRKGDSNNYGLCTLDQIIPYYGELLYNHACLTYNISMVVKFKANPIEKIRDILRDQNGILLTSDLAKYEIPRTYLSILEMNGEIQRVSRGVYSDKNYMIDEMVSIQSRYKGAIFSHETALYLLELTDRSPLFYSVTVPTGYNASSLKAGGAKVYFVNRDLYLLGLTSMKSLHGNDIKTFNLERTICDVMRSRNRIDVQFINESLKRYVGKKERNIDLLYNYALQFSIQKIIKETIEVLL